MPSPNQAIILLIALTFICFFVAILFFVVELKESKKQNRKFYIIEMINIVFMLFLSFSSAALVFEAHDIFLEAGLLDE